VVPLVPLPGLPPKSPAPASAESDAGLGRSAPPRASFDHFADAFDHDDGPGLANILFRQGQGAKKQELQDVMGPVQVSGKGRAAPGAARTISARDLISIDPKIGYAIVRVVPGKP